MLLQMLPDTLYFYSVGKLHGGWGINHAATVFFYSFGNYAAAYWEFFCFYWSVHIAWTKQRKIHYDNRTFIFVQRNKTKDVTI
jgi:hypothetical protein